MDLKLLLESETQSQDGYHKIFKYIFIDKDRIWHGHLYADLTTLWLRHSGSLRKTLKPSFRKFTCWQSHVGHTQNFGPFAQPQKMMSPGQQENLPSPRARKAFTHQSCTFGVRETLAGRAENPSPAAILHTEVHLPLTSATMSFLFSAW